MIGKSITQICRKLIFLILASAVVFTFPQHPSGAAERSSGCLPTLPHGMSQFEFEEIRKVYLGDETPEGLAILSKLDLKLTDYPIFILMTIIKQIENKVFLLSLVNLEIFSMSIGKKHFCQEHYLSEVAASLRHASIEPFISGDEFNLGVWDSFGHLHLSDFRLGSYESAKCVMQNSQFEIWTLDRDPNYTEYPRECVTR